MKTRKLIIVLFISNLCFLNIQGQSIDERIIRIPVKLPGAENEKVLDVTLRNGKLFLDDDIYLGEESILRGSDSERSASLSPVTASGSFWPGNVVPFNLTASHPERGNILQAMTHIASRTSITFVPRTNESNFLSFSAKEDGCYSSIGMVGGEQFINMQSGCGYPAAIHELGHALGLFHEQSRTDRDKYVNINWQNIISGKESNFQKYIERGYSGIDFDVYDYESIMHYTAKAFSINGQPTIEVKTPPAPPGTVIGTGRSLSKVDILSINNMYRVVPRSTSEIQLSDEIATFPNPPCIGVSTEFTVSLEAENPDTLTKVNFQYVLHNFRNGNVVEMLGEPFTLEAGLISSNINLTIEEAEKGDYLLVLWQLGEEGNLDQVVNDGDFLNGRRIELTDDCIQTELDPYEDNDQEVSRYKINPPQSDSIYMFSAVGASVHSIQDIDYYHLILPDDINYSLEAVLNDNEDDESVWTNDVVVDYKIEGGKWAGYNDASIAISDLYNGKDVTLRVRSHFPDDTGSYQLDLNVQIDPNPMLLVESNRYSIEAEDTVFKIPIQSNRNWLVEGDAEWLMEFENEGFGFDTLLVPCTINSSFDEREVEISLSTIDGDIEVVVRLFQKGLLRKLSAEYSQIPVCGDAGEGLIWVNSNAQWDATTSDPWIDIIEVTGSEDGWIRFTVTDNISNNARNGEILLSTEGVSRRVKVFQPGQRSNGACVDPLYLEVSPEEGSITFEVNTLQEWVINQFTESLDVRSPLTGNGNATIEVAYPALDEEEDEKVYRVDLAVQNVGVFQIVLLQTVDFSSSVENEVAIDDILQIVNPIGEELIVTLQSAEISGNVTLEFRNLSGKELWTKGINYVPSQIIRLSLESLNLVPGVYFLTLRSGQNQWTKKLIKVH